MCDIPWSPKLTFSIAPENGWLEEDPFLLGKPIFRGETLVLGRVHCPDFCRFFVGKTLLQKGLQYYKVYPPEV